MKNFVKILFVSIMCLSLVACGGNSKPKTVKVGDKEVFNGVDSYVESEQIQEQVKSTSEMMDNMGIKLEVVSEGDAMIYRYTFKEQASIDEKGKESIRESLKSQSTVFVSLVEDIRDNTNVENPKIILEYYNADGTKIVDYTYDLNSAKDVEKEDKKKEDKKEEKKEESKDDKAESKDK